MSAIPPKLIPASYAPSSSRAGGLDVITPGLVQVWYSTETLDALQTIILDLAPSRVACLSCPSVFYHLSEQARAKHGLANFEFDRRWEDDDGFVFYDCYRPAELPDELMGSFDLIIADPPALTDQTLECYATTIKLLAVPSGACILFSTLESFDVTMLELLGLSPQRFKPDLPGFALDGRWDFFSNFKSETLSQPNAVADAKRAAAAEQESEADEYGVGYHQAQHEI